jgi:hypothetical protein
MIHYLPIALTIGFLPIGILLLREILIAFKGVGEDSASIARARLFVDFGCLLLDAPRYRLIVNNKPTLIVSELQIPSVLKAHGITNDRIIEMALNGESFTINGDECRFEKKENRQNDPNRI